MKVYVIGIFMASILAASLWGASASGCLDVVGLKLVTMMQTATIHAAIFSCGMWFAGGGAIPGFNVPAPGQACTRALAGLTVTTGVRVAIVGASDALKK